MGQGSPGISYWILQVWFIPYGFGESIKIIPGGMTTRRGGAALTKTLSEGLFLAKENLNIMSYCI